MLGESGEDLRSAPLQRTDASYVHAAAKGGGIWRSCQAGGPGDVRLPLVTCQGAQVARNGASTAHSGVAGTPGEASGPSLMCPLEHVSARADPAAEQDEVTVQALVPQGRCTTDQHHQGNFRWRNCTLSPQAQSQTTWPPTSPEP